VTLILEKTLDLLIKDNDRSVDYLVKGEMANALGILEKMEKLMEVILLLLWGFIDCCIVSSNKWKNFG
jgi:hypothetical protein